MFFPGALFTSHVFFMVQGKTARIEHRFLPLPEKSLQLRAHIRAEAAGSRMPRNLPSVGPLEQTSPSSSTHQRSRAGQDPLPPIETTNWLSW